jgi:hypothetical protein
MVVGLVLMSSAAMAEDLTGRDRFLCSARNVTACTEDGVCVNGTPLEFNVPQFVEVDLGAKMLSTTAAAPEYRTTPINHLKREDGVILLQGSQGDRAFSFMINESLGLATVAIATDGFNIGVFGACTPMPAAK